jgi:Zn finger protein HypA/HybF involved in hydrogenase expression
MGYKRDKMVYRLELQLSVTYFDGTKCDKNFKVDINPAKKETTIWCPSCFTQLTKQNNHTCEKCKYKITDYEYGKI